MKPSKFKCKCFVKTVFYKILTIKSFFDLTKQNSCRKIFIYSDRIKIRHLFGFRFDKIIEKIFDCKKRNIIIGEQYTKTKYKKFVLCRKYREIKINDFFKSLGLNFYDYVKNVFKENGLEAPNLLFITQNCVFKEEKEILDFLTLANKDLFEKIEAARIIEKLNREVNQ